MVNLHVLIRDSFGVVKICSLREEGRLKTGVSIKSYDYIRLDWILLLLAYILVSCNLQFDSMRPKTRDNDFLENTKIDLVSCRGLWCLHHIQGREAD